MLRLPTIGRLWEGFAVQADKEGWGAARFLAALCEHEIADRDQRRIARHLNESGLPAGKTFATFDFAAVLRKAHVLALADSDTWLDQGANILCFGPSGVGKSHAAAAIGYALIERGKRGDRPPRPPRDDSGVQHRELSPPGSDASPAGRRLSRSRGARRSASS
jgi:DNA replication protein DnaC